MGPTHADPASLASQGGSLALSRTLSDVALNRAVASLYARMKLVDVGLQVRKRRRKPKGRKSTPLNAAGSDPATSATSSTAGSLHQDAQQQQTEHGAMAATQASWSLQNTEAAAAAAVAVAGTGTVGSAVVPFPLGPAQNDSRGREDEKEIGQSESQEFEQRGQEENEEEEEEVGSEGSTVSEGDSASRAEEGNDGDEEEEYVTVRLVAVPGVTLDDVAALQDSLSGFHRRVPSSLAMAHVRVSQSEAFARGCR